jgi:integrase/recombinase XerC
MRLISLKTIEDVNYGQIRSWIVALVDGGMSNVSVNRKVASLKAIYKFLLKQNKYNIPLKHKALKTAKVLQIPFSEKEVAEVLGEIQSPVGFEEVRNKLIIDLFYTTGIRRTELIHLKISDIESKFSIRCLEKE